MTVGGDTTDLGRLAHDAAFWSAVSEICSDGVLSRNESTSLERAFGPEKVSSLVQFLSGETAATAESFIQTNSPS